MTMERKLLSFPGNRVLILLAWMAVTSCPVPSGGATGGDLASVVVASGFVQPLYVDAPPADTSRIFVVEQVGTIRIVLIDSGLTETTPFLDISAAVTTADHQGLLGLAFHPDYSSNGYFYVMYTDLNGDSVVSRFTVSADPNVANPGTELVIMSVVMNEGRHNGGMLAFGPDGYLYVGVADDFDTASSQDRTSLYGSILRLDIDGGSPYAIPPDNPFVGNPSGWRE